MVVETFNRLNIRYLITGSVASMAYGEPRLTNDIDIVAAIDGSHVGALKACFPAGEFYLSAEAMREAVRTKGQFNVIHPDSGLKVDVMVKQNTPFDESRFSRARKISPEQGYSADFASPEDVIIKKMEYYKLGGSEKHLRDITGIMKISGEMIDSGYIEKWSQSLGLTEVWKAIQKAGTPEVLNDFGSL